ncbi:MAG TPA: TetR/AcrR family transcriptional regulator [Methanomassiliicoccales archaeon]|nr:TetR/AcrR family transcriptional regulator [Methanomassiliicoccales archaeon]
MATRMKGDARRSQILDAALFIVHTKGIHSLTLRELADRVGVSEAALFRHFKGKEDIVDSLASTVFDENQFFPHGEGPWEAMENMLKWQLENFQQNPMHTSILFQEDIFREFPPVKERFDLRRSSRSSLIAQLIREGKASGAFSPDVDAEAFSLLFMGGLRLAVLEWRHANFSYDLREKAPPLLRMLRKCLEAEG